MKKDGIFVGPISPDRGRLRNNRGVVELWNWEEEEEKEGSGLAGILHRDYFESKPSAMAIKGAQGVCFNKERNIEWQGADINFQVYLIERGKERRRRRAREERKWGGGEESGWWTETGNERNLWEEKEEKAGSRYVKRLENSRFGFSK